MNQSTKSEAPSAAPRKQSEETKLKLRKRQIERELTAVAKKVKAFEEMQNEVKNASDVKQKLDLELGTIKQKLIKELGLA